MITKCSKCKDYLLRDTARHCWLCISPLCERCWNKEKGQCGHEVAESITNMVSSALAHGRDPSDELDRMLQYERAKTWN